MGNLINVKIDITVSKFVDILMWKLLPFPMKLWAFCTFYSFIYKKTKNNNNDNNNNNKEEIFWIKCLLNVNV